jgi:hypothetical protein
VKPHEKGIAVNSIPTVYKSIRFRSRLEARWAAFFDLIGWRWFYEPIDLKGYIPDFIIQFPKRQLLVEVKPLTAPGPVLKAAKEKIAASGWEGRDDGDLESGAALIVGCGVNLDPSQDDACCIADSIGWLQDFSWGVDGYDACYLARCPICRRTFYWNQYTLWNCPHCGKWTDKPYHYTSDCYPDAEELLARAQNAVQWSAA